jgi:hypothetical protein
MYKAGGSCSSWVEDNSAMMEEKEQLFQQYYEVTVQIQKALMNDQWEEAVLLLDRKDELIVALNDQVSDINPAIQAIIIETLRLEEGIKEALRKEKERVYAAIHSVKKEQLFTQRYTQQEVVPGGFFYDKRK